MFIIYLNMRKSCSVLWTFSHVINIILRGMIKGWWYRYQSRQTNTVVMFFQYYICKFPLFSAKYMIKHICRQFKPWIKSFITLYQYFRLCNISYWALGCLGGLSLATWCKSKLSIHIHYKCITYHIWTIQLYGFHTFLSYLVLSSLQYARIYYL
jgi:hypothetical protein